jgi:hypothetical protein
LEWLLRVESGAFLGSLFPGIHAKICRDAERLCVVGIVREDSDADAGAYAQGVTIHFEWILEEFGEGAADTYCVSAAHRLFQDDGKLITAGAGNCVRPAHAAEKKAPDALEQFITDMMTNRVVDQLEVVEVDEQKRGLRSAAT